MSNGQANGNANGLPAEYSFGNPPPMGNEFIGGRVGIPPAPEKKVKMRDYRAYSLAQPYNMRARIREGTFLSIVGCGM